MRVRFGYVAIAMRLDKVTSSSPVTYKKYSSIESERERLSLLKRVTQSNLIDLIKILLLSYQDFENTELIQHMTQFHSVHLLLDRPFGINQLLFYQPLKL